MVRLGNCFTIIRNGASIKQIDGASGLPITRIETISKCEINRDKFGYANICDEEKYKDYFLHDDDILMSHINSEKHLGKCAIYHKEKDEKIIHGMNLLMLRANKTVISPQYAVYYFETPFFKQQIVNITKKSVNQASFTVTALKEIEIPLLSYEKQNKIVKILDKLNEIINKRQQQLKKLDELVKSRFIEMFGDPITNSYNLPIVPLGELSELITKGASPSWQGFSYTDDRTQTLFITSENVREGYIDLSFPKYIEDGFNDKQKRSVIHKGDFLINIVGASIGRAAQFNFDCKANMNQAAALVRINDKRIKDNYLLIYLNSEKAQRMYDLMKSDTGRANLSLKDISDLSILLPPIAQQEKFEKFFMQTDKSKLEIQKSLDKLEILKKSLMQQYFD